MIRISGCILIILCTTGIGWYSAAVIQKRIQELEWFHFLLNAICEELTYSMAPVEEILASVSNRRELRRIPLLTLYQHESIQGAPFPDCWKTAVASVSWNIGKEDKLMILSLAEVFGAYDCKNQLDAIHLLQQRIEKRIQEEKAYREQHSKLYHTLGILSGVGLCILLY